jgi:hypothetical protein
MTLDEFATWFNEEVRALIETQQEVWSESAFTRLVLDHLEEIGMVEGADICFYEGQFRNAGIRINAFAISEDESQLDLFASLFDDRRMAIKLEAEQVRRAAIRAARFFHAALEGLADRIDPSDCAHELAARIKALAGHVERLRIFVLSDGISPALDIRPEKLHGGSLTLSTEIHDLDRLHRTMQAGLPRDEIDVDFVELVGHSIPCLAVPEVEGLYSAYLTSLPGDLLYRLYEEYGDRLLEFNVRSFLSARGKVNKGIRATLKEEPEKFFAFNNGIVATVDDIRLERLPDGQEAIRSIRGLQIVNGGQTTASIRHAAKTDRSDLSTVQVPAKISRIVPDQLESMVSQISRYANSQNTVHPADFSANAPFHIELERLSQSIWSPLGGTPVRWFYERARGSYQVAVAKSGPAFKRKCPADHKLTKTDLAKYLHAWEQKPHLVSLGAQKNFDAFMQGLRMTHGENWVPDQDWYRRLIGQTILYRATQKVVRQMRFPAHQANITAYTVAYMSWRTGRNLDFERIWNAQVISDDLIDLLKSWAPKMDSALRDTAGARMITEWAKKEACWHQIRELDLDMPGRLPPEVVSMATGGEGSGGEAVRMDPVDLDNISACQAVDGETWLRIHAWGQKTGNLEKWQNGIAHTLAGYAASGWIRQPSVKQAKHGVAILRKAREAGVLQEP